MRDSRPPSTRVEPTLHRHSLTCTAPRDPQLKAMSQLPIKWTGTFGIGKTVRNVICNKRDQVDGKYRDCHPCKVTFMSQSTAEEKRLKAAEKEKCKDKWAEELDYTAAQVDRIKNETIRMRLGFRKNKVSTCVYVTSPKRSLYAR